MGGKFLKALGRLVRLDAWSITNKTPDFCGLAVRVISCKTLSQLAQIGRYATT